MTGEPSVKVAKKGTDGNDNLAESSEKDEEVVYKA